ncbi:MAG: hypothetical protein AAGE03_15440 [Pseudomonadota bacterium]
MPKPETTPAAAGSDARGQARALLSMLESGSGSPDQSIPPDRLRDLARDLIAKVEARETPQPAPQGAEPPPSRPSLFRNATPFATATVAPPRPVAPPQQPSVSPQSDELPAPISAQDAMETQRLAPSLARPRWAKNRAAVEALLKSAFRPEEADAEHPAILALDLAGRPPREQAERLRKVPAGRIRATHRHLIELERGQT